MDHFKQKIKEDLLLFYYATNIPFCVFNNLQQDLLRYPVIASMDCSPHTMKYCIKMLKERSGRVHLPLLIASGTCFFALLQLDSETNVMFGPLSSVPLTYREFSNTNRDFSTPEDLMHLYRVIQQSPHIKPAQFAQSMSLFLKLVFHEDISAHEILANRIDLYKKNTGSKTDIPQKSDHIVGTAALEFEKRILFCIQNGHMNELKKLIDNAPFLSIREHFPATIEELETEFIIYATLCLKTVIDGGMNLQKAFTIFDIYIAKIPSLTTMEDLASMCAQLSIDYCQQIIEIHHKQTDSYVVTQCIQYIQNHIDSRITVDDLAKHCHLSKRTITRHFLEYYHTPVAEHILQLKLREAAFLLTNSTFSLVEISNQLAFSSQSHFSVAFKKKYNFTPQQYRERFRID